MQHTISIDIVYELPFGKGKQFPDGEVPTTEMHNGNFGYGMGGPVSIPKVYNGKKAFLSFYFQDDWHFNHSLTLTSDSAAVLESFVLNSLKLQEST